MAAGNRGRSAAPACAAGQAIGRQTFRNAEYCRRDARRERESASGCLARSFTGRILYSLSISFSLSVTRMRSLRLFRRGSPNSKPLGSAPRCLGTGTRQAFSLAETAKTLRRDGLLFRASPSQTPSTERSARCNANRFEELACVLTPSNKEGRTDEAFYEDQTATESLFQLMLAHSVEGVFWKRRSLRSTQLVALCGCCARLLFCLRSHRSDSFENNLRDGAVDGGRSQLRSNVIAFFLSGVFHRSERTKVVDYHWKWTACCCILVGIVHAVPF